MTQNDSAPTWDQLASPYCGCPLCSLVPNEPPKLLGDTARFDCKICGKYDLPRDCFERYFSEASTRPWQGSAKSQIAIRLAVSYWLNQASANGSIPILTSEHMAQTIAAPYTPDPKTLMDNIVRKLGHGIRWEHQEIDGYDFARLGANHFNELETALEELQEAGLVKTRPSKKHGDLVARLTVAGWDRWSAIERGQSHGSGAFLAMKFGTELDTTFKPAVQEACRQAGFSLMRLDDKPEPGLIDILMEKAILDARFVVADLTYDNSGAYWEAGFAHGLSKPVIYTCRKGSAVHFDVRNWQRIEWSEDDLPNAQRQLVAMIELLVPGARSAVRSL